MSTVFKQKVSWVDGHGWRKFGLFLRWDGDFAICQDGAHRARIYKANLTFENN